MMENIIMKLNTILKKVLVVLMTAMSSILVINVFCRYLLNFSLTWSSELARYFMIWAAFLGAVILVNTGEHIGVDILERSLKGLLRKILQLLIILGSSIFFLILVYYGILLVKLTTGQVSATLRFLPMNVVYSIIPFSGLLMLFGSVVKFCSILLKGLSE